MGGVPAFDLVADGQEFVYTQVADHIAARIAAGDFAPLSRLPGEFALAREYGVSEGSVRRALHALRQRNLVITVFPKGTFVKAVI